MDSASFEDTVKRLKEVDAVVTKLDPAIRGDAFSLLKSYVTGGVVRAEAPGRTPPGASNGGVEAEAIDLTDAENFFTEHEGGKPAENAYLTVAYLYSQYGASPFSIDDVRAVANHAGLTLPERVDVTLAGAKKSGKQLFKRAGRGRLQPNVHGETYLRNTFDIARGTKRRAS
jgi:hypothetical protein